MNTAIIVAAGNGTRMNTDCGSKQFIKLGGIPVIVRTLRTFCTLPQIDDIIIVTRKCDIKVIKSYIKEYNITKIRKITIGGDTRQESVLRGLLSLKAGENDNVLIHDGARPFIKQEYIIKTICKLDGGTYKCAAVGVPVKDTIKQVDENGVICGTPDRESLISIQTPQGFKYGLILDAHKRAKESGTSVTDDCAVIECMTHEKIRVIRGDYNNIKITTPEDIPLGESILKNIE